MTAIASPTTNMHRPIAAVVGGACFAPFNRPVGLGDAEFRPQPLNSNSAAFKLSGGGSQRRTFL